MVKGESSIIDAGNGLGIRHIEVVFASSFPSSLQTDIKRRLELWIKCQKDKLPLGRNGEIDRSFLPNETCFPEANQIIKARIVDDNDDAGCSSAALFLPGCPFVVHTYELSREEISIEEIEPSGGGAEWTAGCDSLTLPPVWVTVKGTTAA